MMALVVYDSEFGNTALIAKTIGDVLSAQAVRVGEVNIDDLDEMDILVVGSPTQRLTYTGGTKSFLKRIPSRGLKGKYAAAFDTRLTQKEVEETKVFNFFVRIFGYAAEPIAKELKKKGAELVCSAEGFYVQGVEGPLVEGELERAEGWAQQIAGMA